MLAKTLLDTNSCDARKKQNNFFYAAICKCIHLDCLIRNYIWIVSFSRNFHGCVESKSLILLKYAIGEFQYHRAE